MVFDHFDFLAPFYDRAIRLKNPERWLKVGLLPCAGLMLDAGGGTGRIAAALSQYVNKVIVADLSFGMLRQARLRHSLDCVDAPSEKLPFKDNYFDRVIMVDAFHHILDPQQTAAELWRVLKPGGRLIIEEPDIRTFMIKLVAFAEKITLMGSHFIAPPRIVTYFTHSNARTAIYREGYNAWVIIDKLKPGL